MGISTEYSPCPSPHTKDPTDGSGSLFLGPPSLSDQQHALWGLRVSVGRYMGDFGEGVRFSRSGTLLISPSLIGPIPLGPLLQTLKAGPQHPGLLPCVLKDTFQGQAPGERPQLSPVPWLGTHLSCFLIAVAACAVCPVKGDWASPPPPSTSLSQSPPLPTEACAPTKARDPQPQTRSALKNLPAPAALE